MNGNAATVLRWYVVERSRRAAPGALVIDDDGIARLTVKPDSERWADACLLCRGVPRDTLELLHVLTFGEKFTPYRNEVPEDQATRFSAEHHQAGKVSLVMPRARQLDLYTAARLVGMTGQRARRAYHEALLVVLGNLERRRVA